jgi:hypothetical protein
MVVLALTFVWAVLVAGSALWHQPVKGKNVAFAPCTRAKVSRTPMLALLNSWGEFQHARLDEEEDEDEDEKADDEYDKY